MPILHLKQSLLDFDVELEIRLNPKLHDREIRLDNGWNITIGRGLDFYQKPEKLSLTGVSLEQPIKINTSCLSLQIHLCQK